MHSVFTLYQVLCQALSMYQVSRIEIYLMLEGTEALRGCNVAKVTVLSSNGHIVS